MIIFIMQEGSRIKAKVDNIICECSLRIFLQEKDSFSSKFLNNRFLDNDICTMEISHILSKMATSTQPYLA